MSRLQPIQTQLATGRTKELLEATRAKFAGTPNMALVMANSPAVLQAYLAFETALASGRLPVKLRQEIALEVGELDGCQYSVSAHTAVSKLLGLTDEEIEQARDGRAKSQQEEAALAFARQVVATGGKPSDADFDAVRQADYSDGEIAEIIANVALNIFTNYFNNSVQVEIDFPRVALHRAA
jgi:uncharacterized peroxidase-related enzyme